MVIFLNKLYKLYICR